MKFKIEWIEKNVTKSGKVKADATLVDEKGVTSDKVTIWADFPDFEKLMPGQDVWGDIVGKSNVVNGKTYVNRTLYPGKTDTMSNPKPAPWVPTVPGYNRGGGAQLQAKAQAIEKAQDKKEESIKVSSTMRDAVLIALAECGGNADHEHYKSRILHWRNWLWSNWDKDPMDEPPFN